jgi:hypothetical protein
LLLLMLLMPPATATATATADHDAPRRKTVTAAGPLRPEVRSHRSPPSTAPSIEPSIEPSTLRPSTVHRSIVAGPKQEAARLSCPSLNSGSGGTFLAWRAATTATSVPAATTAPNALPNALPNASPTATLPYCHISQRYPGPSHMCFMHQTPKDPATQRPSDPESQRGWAPRARRACFLPVESRRHMRNGHGRYSPHSTVHDASSVARHALTLLSVTITFTGNITNNNTNNTNTAHAHTRPHDVRSRLGKDCAWPIALRCPVSTNRRSLTRRSRFAAADLSQLASHAG